MLRYGYMTLGGLGMVLLPCLIMTTIFTVNGFRYEGWAGMGHAMAAMVVGFISGVVTITVLPAYIKAGVWLWPLVIVLLGTGGFAAMLVWDPAELRDYVVLFAVITVGAVLALAGLIPHLMALRSA